MSNLDNSRLLILKDKMKQGSERLSLNWSEVQSIGMGALLAAAGAALTYLTQYLANVDFGQYTPMVTAIGAVLINAARKWISDNTRNIEVKR